MIETTLQKFTTPVVFGFTIPSLIWFGLSCFLVGLVAGLMVAHWGALALIELETWRRNFNDK